METPRPVAEAENRLEGFNGEREKIVSTVERRLVQARLDAADQGPEASLEYVLNDVAFAEIRRYEKTKTRDGKKKLQRWRDLAHQLGHMPEADKRRELERLVHGYASDIAGNFNPRVYRFANDILPPALSFLLAPISGVREGLAALGSIEGKVRVEGPIDLVRAACERGTLVVTPTHTSNLDSIVLGFALNKTKLPPVTYGAGKNLFSNPLISYFMHNLGAYRVDRRLKFSLYKEVLKEYSTVLLERGFHSLFFPGGTRSRSNMVEQKLKLGLLGTSLTAYQNTLREGTSTRRIYVVPATINYRLVLEAETLIEDYLEETGQSRYIIEDDEFSRAGRIIEFLRKLLACGSAAVIRLGRPLDVFGNETDDDGESLDRRGRRIDPSQFFRDASGKIATDPQRDAVYTRTLGQSVARAFLRDTVYLSTPIVSRVLLDSIRRRAPSRDLYQLLRLPPSAVTVPIEEVYEGIERLRDRIRANPAWGRLDETVDDVDAEEVVTDALLSAGAYHTRPLLTRSGDSLRAGYMKLLYYYQNRTSHIPPESSP
jgi:glycerol-3-phosphate O-acyltransferase